MHFGTREKLIVFVVGFLVLIIPVTSFVIAYRFRAQQNAKADFDQSIEDYQPVTKEASGSSLIDEVNKALSDSRPGSKPTPIASETPSESDLGAKLILGPSMDFKIAMEGRPKDKNSSGKLFLGIAKGAEKINPTYLLSFSIDLPDSGLYSGVSLSGLDTGEDYTAYLKGRAQIATSSAFTVKPNITNLGNLFMLSGDLNEDNMINSTDQSIALKAMGSRPGSSNWNELADLNYDAIVNSLDLAIVTRNIGKVGAGGAYISRSPIASSSASLRSPTLGTPQLPATASSGMFKVPAEGGHWIWVPE